MGTMRDIFPNHSADEIIKEIDEFEESSFIVIGKLLRKHDFTEEYFRLEEFQHIGIGKHRILIRLSMELFDGSWIETIRFYEACNRKDDEPHYEDLTVTLLIAFASAFLASVGVEIGKTVVRKIKEKTRKAGKSENARTVFYIPVKYVLYATALREQFRISQTRSDWSFYLTDTEYLHVLGELKQELTISTLSSRKHLGTIDTQEKVQKFCAEYFRKHGFLSQDPVDEFLDEIVSSIWRETEGVDKQEGRDSDSTR